MPADETVEWGWDRGLFAQMEPLTFEQVRERADWGYSGWPVCRCQGGEWVEVPEKPDGVRRGGDWYDWAAAGLPTEGTDER